MKRYALITGALSVGIIGYLIYDANVKGIFPALFLFIGMFSLLMFCLLPGYDEQISEKLSGYMTNKPWMYWIFLVFPFTVYLLTFVTQHDFWGVHLLYFSIYIITPFVLTYLFKQVNHTVRYIISIITAAILWIPFDHRWYKYFWPEKFPFAYEFISL